ncbi:hypothetical protein SLS60_002216 [Paraconiothyrium brasiliense]|uniref:Uncharacterized protein n=1 Tax=Paraconiothyrium brasiliense TaxID=300254 RepID=A0ABR3S1I2_9PLEO
MTATPSASTTARRRVLHPIGTLAEIQDPEAEAAFAKVKEEEDGQETSAKKKIGSHTVAAHEVITPPSSSERPKRERKAKTNKFLAEVELDLDDDDDEQVHVRDHLSPFGGAGSKRRLDFKDASPTTKEQSPKRARIGRSEIMKAPTPLSAEWDMSPQQKAELQTKTYNELSEVRGIRPSQHPTIMKDQFGVDIVPGPGHLGGQPQTDSVLHHSEPTPYSRPMKIPMSISRNRKPRKSGEEFMEEVRDKVRMKLHKDYGWPHPVPAFTTPPTESPAGEPREGNLRDLVDREASNLHHNLTLDEDQQSELLAVMKGAVRKFGNDLFKAMPTGFRAMAKPGLDLALEHLTYAQQQQVVALVQTQAGNKLREFEGEADLAYAGPQHNLGPESRDPSRESFERST